MGETQLPESFECLIINLTPSKLSAILSEPWAYTPCQNAIDALVYKNTSYIPEWNVHPPSPNFIYLNSPGGWTFHSRKYEVIFYIPMHSDMEYMPSRVLKIEIFSGTAKFSSLYAGASRMPPRVLAVWPKTLRGQNYWRAPHMSNLIPLTW